MTGILRNVTALVAIAPSSCFLHTVFVGAGAVCEQTFYTLSLAAIDLNP